MMSESPVLGDIRALLFRFRPHDLRPLIIEEPIPSRELKEENKPGCFGAIGLGLQHRPGCPCEWASRCKQSQEDC